MRILLGSAHPHIPQIAGGAQTSAHELALELAQRGHHVAMLAGLTPAGLLGTRARILRKLGRHEAPADDALGYRTYRTFHPREAVEEVAARERPDVVVLQSGFPVPIAERFLALGVPTVVYLRNVEFEDLGGDPSALVGARFVANSHFTSGRYAQAFGIESAVVYPLFRPERYRTPTRRERVVFINPHPHKGVDTALDLAQACPDIPFTFVEAWTLSPEQRAPLLARLERLPNVRLVPRTRDMRAVYAEARIVLVPSRWEEAFGRVVVEAHVSGIPVVASRCGGLPEAVSDGGVLVDRDAPIGAWVAALRGLWDDEARYEAASRAASACAARPDLDRDRQIARLLAVFADARAALATPAQPAVRAARASSPASPIPQEARGR